MASWQSEAVAELYKQWTKDLNNFELVVGPPGPQQRLLDHVFCLIPGAEHPVAVGQQASPISLGVTDEIVAIRGTVRGHGYCRCRL